MYQFSPIVPAIIPTSAESLVQTLRQLSGVPEIHIDVVDGVFVPAISWPYEPVAEPVSLKSHLDQFSLEVDLMVQEPLPAAAAWVLAGADRLVFHCETISLEAFKQFSAQPAVSVGICALMDTPVATLAPYLEYADYAQVMGIAQIGRQGQPFDERVFERVDYIRSVQPTLPLSIDGSVNQATLRDIITHQLERYIVGSAIVQQANPLQAYEALVSLWQSTVQ